MSWFERIALLLFAAALAFWVVTKALGDESAFGLVILFGALAAAVLALRLWKRRRTRPLQ